MQTRTMGADGPTDECKRSIQRQNIICQIHATLQNCSPSRSDLRLDWIPQSELGGMKQNRSCLSPNISLTHLLSCRCEDAQDPIITSLSPCSTTLPSMSAVHLEANHQIPFLTAEPWIRKEGISLIGLRLV